MSGGVRPSAQIQQELQLCTEEQLLEVCGHQVVEELTISALLKN